MSALAIEARPFKAGDERLLFEGLTRAATSPAAPARTLEELRWRYVAAPHGSCLALARDAAGAVVAAIAATRQRVRFQGSQVHWLEVGDLFNDFARGSGLARARGLLLAGRAFAETFGGFAPEKHPVLYGLPDRRAHRLGLRHLEWEVLRSENVLRAPCPAFGAQSGAAVTIEPVGSFPSAIEALFQRASAGREAILVRDPAYLDWRYLQGPGPRPEIALGHRRGELEGYAVLRGGLLVDWLVAEDDGVARALLGWAAARARAAGHAELALVVPDSSPEWLRLQGFGFRAHGLPEYLCFRSFQRPAIMSWLFKHWHYTRGDIERGP